MFGVDRGAWWRIRAELGLGVPGEEVMAPEGERSRRHEEVLKKEVHFMIGFSPMTISR